MSQSILDVKAIFGKAVELNSPVDRDHFLAEACGDRLELRGEVESLLKALDEAGEFLEKPASQPTFPWQDPGAGEPPGTAIGPYVLIERIGEGGMGVVYRARQTHPVHREVALKIIKPGMDTERIIGRFEVERQSLALMDHANIARVLDAGATDTGRPYFVMDLVDGVPITEYCDRQRLTITQRLELFVLVCRAVQHAHQKGVIHRDLKPSNVLVTVQDGVPVPKIIDFGIAKATGQERTLDATLTGPAQVVGTPLYMSPEQAELGNRDIDTRSDVYSLGVLLYELLTGITPFEQKRLKQAALDEVCRIIREQDPPRPSTRLSTLTDADRSSISANRQTDPRHLARSLHGELDWIVLKCLEKDRARRYESASALADDLMRYLSDRPVEAGPPSAWYRFAKSVRRNRVRLTTVSLIGIALIAATSVSIWQAQREKKAAAEAMARANETDQVIEYLIKDIFGAAAPEKWQGGRPMTIVEVLERAEGDIGERFRGQPLVEARCHLALSEMYLRLDEKKARSHAEQAVAQFSRMLGPQDPYTLKARWAYLDVLNLHWADVDVQELRVPMLRALLSDRRRVLGPTHPDTINTMSSLGDALVALRQFDEAKALAERACADAQRLLGPEHPTTLSALRVRGVVATCRGDLPQGEVRFRQCVEANLRAHGANHTWSIEALNHLADVLHMEGKTAEAIRIEENAYDAARKTQGVHGYWVYWSFGKLAGFYRGARNWLALRDLAETRARELLASWSDLNPRLRLDRAGELGQTIGELAALPTSVPFDTDLADRVIAEIAVAIEGAKREGVDPKRLASACNNVAWHLLTSANVGRHAATALALVREAVALRPDDRPSLNTLGVALYRTGRFAESVAVLECSLAAGKGESSAYDLLFLAMALHRLGDIARARSDFDRAVKWLEAHPHLSPGNLAELSTFRTEAERVLTGPPGELPADPFAR